MHSQPAALLPSLTLICSGQIQKLPDLVSIVPHGHVVFDSALAKTIQKI
jgi:hypothetical protein